MAGGGRAHTSQFSRIKQRPPATDLSGPKASAESLTPRRSNLAVADAVDFQLDLFPSAAAPGSVFSSGRGSSGAGPGVVEGSTLSEGTIRGGSRNNNVHILSGFLLWGIGGADGEGWTPSTFLPSLIPNATSTSASGSKREDIWLASLPSTSTSPRCRSLSLPPAGTDSGARSVERTCRLSALVPSPPRS